jgi:hypothetical protein
MKKHLDVSRTATPKEAFVRFPGSVSADRANALFEKAREQMSADVDRALQVAQRVREVQSHDDGQVQEPYCVDLGEYPAADWPVVLYEFHCFAVLGEGCQRIVALLQPADQPRAQGDCAVAPRKGSAAPEAHRRQERTARVDP